MEKRRLTGTEEELSVIGFGGMVLAGETQTDANRYVDAAIDRGINYFDVAPSYGNAQERLGPALKSYRQNVFLTCKTLLRDKNGAEVELINSLKELKTSYIDLYQFHSVNNLEDVAAIVSPQGALETVLEARRKGNVRFIGFSSHSEECAIELMRAFDFDTILFPLNWACWYKNNFGQRTLNLAIKKKMGILAIKALAKRRWFPEEKKKWSKCWYCPVEKDEADIALRFTLSLPVTAAVSPSHAELLWWACDAAERYRPPTEEENELLRIESQDLNVLFPGELPKSI